MVRKIVIIFFYIVVILCIQGCFICKKHNTQIVTNEEEARKIVLNDVAYHYKTSKEHRKQYGKDFDVFNVYFDTIIENNYVFHVVPNYNNVTLRVDDQIGKVPEVGFPNNFFKIDGKLFIWNDKETPLNQKLLKVLDDYRILDSVDVKYKMNILPIDFEDNRVLIMDHSVNGYFYFVSKTDVTKYKKVPSSKLKKYLQKMSSQPQTKGKDIK